MRGSTRDRQETFHGGASTRGDGSAREEQAHADRIAERITELDGKPDVSPEGLLSRSHSEYVEGDSLVEMIEEDLVAERIAIDTYREIVQYIGDDDPTARRMLEDILANEEELAEDLKTLLEELGKKGRAGQNRCQKRTGLIRLQ